MNDDLATGLRDVDLTPEERRRVAADPEHAKALELGAQLAALSPVSGGASASAVLAAGRRGRSTVRWAASALALAAAVVLVLVLSRTDPTQLRGSFVAIGEVHLAAAVESAGGLTPLAPGGVVPPGDRVVFRVATSGSGVLTLRSGDGAQVWPLAGETWSVDAGEHAPGGTSVQSYRPDVVASAPVVYVATLCPFPDDDPASCTSDQLTVRWAQ